MRHQTFHSALLLVALVAGCLVTSGASAAVVNLQDLNSSVAVITDQQAGMASWVVDDVEHMYQQWFWFRVGDDPEASIDSLLHNDATDVKVTDGNFNPGDDRVKLRYTDPNGRFEVLVDYILTGGLPGSNTSDVAETITIHNLGRGPLEMSFFQYVDFDLNDGDIDDSVQLVNANTMRQTDGLFVAETVATPAPTLTEVALFDSTLDKLNDGSPSNLDGTTSSAGAGDWTWAFQWDIVLGANGSFIISKDKHISLVPEPSSMVLAAIGLVGACFAARRRRPAAA
jgi:hypothetical protein